MKTIKILFALSGLFLNSYSQTTNNYWNLKNTAEWHLSSIPSKQLLIFPESSLQNDLGIGYNRARICWYRMEQLFQYMTPLTPAGIGYDQMQNHFVRDIPANEVYSNNPANFSMQILNVAYYPVERGPYNFDVNPTLYSNGIDMNGNLNTPESRWGGIMQSIPKNIFTSNNLNYLGFWLMDPFVYDSTSNGGKLLINIGNVSEDILKDNRRSSEGGLPATSTVLNVDTTIWGRVSAITFPPETFDNEYSLYYQDLGFDGLANDDEILFYGNFLNSIAGAFGTGSTAYTLAINDPSSDNYQYFLDPDYYFPEVGIFERHKKFNGTEGNTGIFDSGISPTGSTLFPDDEDINGNDILDTAENYYQYEIFLNRDSLIIGQNFLADKKIVTPSNGDGSPVTWYKFLVPLNTNQREIIGNINNLDSSDFDRLVLKDFSQEVNLRFFELAFVSNDLSSINEFHNNSPISVYPNPSMGSVRIESSSQEINSIKVIDLLGRTIYSSNRIENTTETTIDLSEFNAGLYFIEVGSQNNFSVHRIIIDK
jgi:cell surface protein SprA